MTSPKHKPADRRQATSQRRQGNTTDRPVLGEVLTQSAVDSKTGFVKTIIETPKGRKNKYKFDKESGMFECSSALQGGMTFPFDFGFIPSTECEDGDPLDIIILMDEPAFPGCLIHVRVIGVLEAEQTENRKTIRNDRLIGVHTSSVQFGNLMNWKHLALNQRKEIGSFLVYYNKSKGRVFRPIAWRGPKQAFRLLQKSLVKPDSQEEAGLKKPA